MPNIRSSAEIASKWGTVTPQRAEQYKQGVSNPKEDWAKNTKEAEASYEEGVKKSIERKAFGKGVVAAGNEAWQKGAVEKGADRFGPGVAAAQGKYEENFAPYREVIAKTNLPKRGATGSDANYERVKTMGKALHAKKISG